MNIEKFFNKTQKPKSNRRRIYALDELRGFSVFCMVFYHAFFSIGEIFKVPFFLSLLKFFMPAEPFFAAIFIIISGISSNLSHSNLSRGAKLFIVAMAVTLVTSVVEPEYIIQFGVLHRIFFDGFSASVTVRNTTCITKINYIFVWQYREKLSYSSKTTKT